MSEEKFNPLLIDNDEDSLDIADPLIKDAIAKRQAAIFDISHQLANVPYAGSGSKLELVELEQNMRDLLEANTYGYKFIEGFLISMGYNLNKIRDTFRRLTGMEPAVYLDAQPYLDAPGTIPGVNYGWGKSKDAQYDYYFLMPYDAVWVIFGQKGDLLREEVKRFASMEEGRNFLKKKVDDMQLFDKVVEVKKLTNYNQQSLSENFPFGTKTAELIKYIKSIQSTTQPTEIRALLQHELDDNHITGEEFQKLAQMFGLLRVAADPSLAGASEFEQKLFEKPLEEELDERTPQQFFEKQKDDQKGGMVGDVVESVINYVDNLNKDLVNFTVTVRSFKYITQEVSDKIEKTPPVGNQKAEEFFNSSGLISILLDIADNTLPAQMRTKPGLAIFTIVNNEVVTSGTFKGDDNQIYGLNEEGFEKYFSPERQRTSEK